jgi:hypothetical protein
MRIAQHHLPQVLFDTFTSTPEQLAQAAAQPGAMAHAMWKLSKALGHPKTIEALEGQSVDAALIELAAQRLEALKP